MTEGLRGFIRCGMAAVMLLAPIKTAIASPTIGAIVRSADFGIGLVPDDYGTIYGSALADSNYAASNTPWPISLGGVQLFACPATMGVNTIPSTACTALFLLFVSPAQINFYIPPKVAGTLLVANIAGNMVFVSGDFTQGTLRTQGIAYAAAIFIEGFDCFIDPRYAKMGQPNCGLTWTPPSPSVNFWCERGAVADSNGNLLTSTNPARLGQYVTIWATGLGSFGTTKTMEAQVANPQNGPGGYTFPVTYAGESSVSPGLFQINIQIPTALQCGDTQAGLSALPPGNYAWDLSLVLSGYNGNFGIPSSNPIWVPVIVRPGDVQCSQ